METGQEPPHGEFDELVKRLGLVRAPKPPREELDARQKLIDASRIPGGRRHNDPPAHPFYPTPRVSPALLWIMLGSASITVGCGWLLWWWLS